MPERGELVFTLILLAISGFLVHQAYAIDGISEWDSAGTIPLLSTGTMVAAVLYVLVHEAPWRRGGSADRQGPSMTQHGDGPADAGSAPAEGAAADAAGDPAGAGRPAVLPPELLGLGALAVVYVAVIAWVGFYPATAVFITLAMVFLKRGRPLFALLVALLSIAAIYGAFETFFQVRLP